MGRHCWPPLPWTSAFEKRKLTTSSSVYSCGNHSSMIGCTLWKSLMRGICGGWGNSLAEETHVYTEDSARFIHGQGIQSTNEQQERSHTWIHSGLLYCSWDILSHEQFTPHLYTLNYQIPKYVILPVIYPLLPLVRQHTYVSEIPMGCWKLCLFNFFCRCYLSFLQTFGAKTLLVILRQMLPFTWVATMYVIFKESTFFPNFLLKS